MDMSLKMIVPSCCIALIMAACGNATNAADNSTADPGTAIYNSRCTMCHGRDGDLGMSGAKDLTKSTLTKEEMVAVVTHGKGGMIGFEKMLSTKEIDEVVDHVRTLHSTK